MSLTLMVLRRFFSGLIFLLLINCKSNQKDAFNQLKGYALGTTYSISYSSSKLNKNLLSHKVDSIINVINVSMSTYDKYSDISKINKGDSLLEVDTHFIKVYNKATEVWKKTKGYFDPTVGALVNAYGFGPNRTHKSVSPYQLEQILKYTGWEKTKLTSKNTIQKKHPNLFFDFNAIAKGYAVDLISEYLSNHYSQRFGQAIFNLGINEFVNKTDPAKEDYKIRDIHGVSDNKILERIKSQLEWFEEQKKRR